jgi:hypothetical protein
MDSLFSKGCTSGGVGDVWWCVRERGMEWRGRSVGACEVLLPVTVSSHWSGRRFVIFHPKAVLVV